MYLSESQEYGSRCSLLHCSSGPPVTPDSVLGSNCLLDNNGGINNSDNRNGSNSSDAPSKPPSMPRSSTSMSSVSLASLEQHDLAPSPSPSHRLLNIFKTESAEQYQVTPNYLHSSVLIPSTPQDSRDQGVSERCRRRTCEWMYDICDYFQLNREVVGIALFYVDRYFTITFEGSDASGGDCQVPVTRRQFQLVALTGLYIAVKLHGESRQENLVVSFQQQSLNGSAFTGSGSGSQHQQPWNRLKFSLAICASISRNQFAPSEIEACERTMLNTLDWHVNPIVSSGMIIDSLLVYLPSVLSARPSINNGLQGTTDESLTLFVYDCAKYLAELSVSVPALSLVYKPSIVAYASVLYALDNISRPKTVVGSSPGNDYAVLSEHSRREYEHLVLQVSSGHFERERVNVEGAKKIVQAICPNLGELFPPPGVMPGTPTSVRKLA